MEKVFPKKDKEDSLYTTVEWSPRHKWKRAQFQTMCTVYYHLFKKIAYANSGRTHVIRDSGSSKERNCMAKEQGWEGGRFCVVHAFVPFEFWTDEYSAI